MWISSDEREERVLERLGSGLAGHDEPWLQRLLFRHPGALPAGSFEPVFEPLLPLAREVPAGGGFIDLLYTTPEGYLTLVETKLWRNRQAKREVVAQALDYAKEVCRWTFEDLDRQVRRAALDPPEGVLAALRAAGPEGEFLDPAEFQYQVTRNLVAGRFLILIVGDRILPGAEALASFVHRHPTLLFTVGLVEMEAYRSIPGGDVLVVPTVVEHSVQVERAVVRIEPPGHLGVTVEVPEGRTAAGGTSGRAPRVRLTEDAFWEALRANVEDLAAIEAARTLCAFPESIGGYIDPEGSSMVARLPSPGDAGPPLTLFILDTKGWLATWHLGRQLQIAGLPVELAEDYVRSTGALFGVGIADDSESRTKDTWPRWRRPVALTVAAASLQDFLEKAAAFARAVERAAAERG